ncbi:MAG TPA: methionine biosynthesis protein MetW, partial [Alphaproteobacteria bacterium]|nr:methionine biosynthesis protein MetW [Alphaproteobacteria bacterium]
DTPNIHFCSIRDFVALCRELGVQIDRGVAVDHAGRASTVWRSLWLANLLGEQGVFLLRRTDAV